MPTKTKEKSCYHPGALIRAAKNIYSSSTDPMIEAEFIKEGTAGVLIRPHEDGYHWHVNFIGKNEPWWCGAEEFEPFVLKQTKK